MSDPNKILQGRAAVAHRVHTPEVEGSNPSPATIIQAPTPGAFLTDFPHRPRPVAHIGDKLGLGDNLSPHIQVWEVACKCGCGYGTHYGDIDDGILAIFEEIRTAIGNPKIIITSGARCASHNKAVDGAAQSMHLQGCALDMLIPYGVKGYPTRDEMIDIVLAANPDGGVGYKQYGPQGIIHIDTGSRRRW